MIKKVDLEDDDFGKDKIEQVMIRSSHQFALQSIIIGTWKFADVDR